MDVLLKSHNAKPVCEIPDGLHELCADISREVIRYQPSDIYCFIADYLAALMITRENAKIAVRVVQEVVMKSEHIAEILAMTGLELKEIAAAMPRLRKAFRVYLDAMEAQKKTCGCDVDSEVGEECELSITCILREIGVSHQKAQSAAIKIQAAFRGHYERMRLAERRGEISWQRAAVRTVEILREAGVSRHEAAHAATVIQAAYRGYYTRRNFKLRTELRKLRDSAEPKETSAWLKMLLGNSGATFEQIDRAAKVIQRVYREYRKRKSESEEQQRGQFNVSSLGRPDEQSTTSSDVASATVERRELPLSPTETSGDEPEMKNKELRFTSTVQIVEEEIMIQNIAEGNEEDEEKGEQKNEVPGAEEIEAREVESTEHTRDSEDVDEVKSHDNDDSKREEREDEKNED